MLDKIDAAFLVAIVGFGFVALNVLCTVANGVW